MCTDIISRISSLQVEMDKARLLNIGVKPASTLQQAPLGIKIPKQFIWLNLPDGVNDDQWDKDLARMGILNRPPAPNPAPELPVQNSTLANDVDEIMSLNGGTITLSVEIGMIVMRVWQNHSLLAQWMSPSTLLMVEKDGR